MTKLVIKPFKQRLQMDSNGAKTTMASLAKAVDEIHNRNSSSLSFEELYRNAYNLVIQKHGLLLYEGMNANLASHLLTTVERLADVPESNLLDEVAKSFQEHLTTMIMVRDILMYMDRTFVINHKLQPIYELGLHLYRITVWEHPQIQSRVSELLLRAIANERLGLLTDDRSLLKSNISMLLQIGAADNSNVYERDFDGLFLGTTQEFYRNESAHFLATNTASQYVTKAKKRLEEEKTRAMALALPSTTEGPLQNILEIELIERHAKRLVNMENSGFISLLKNDSKIDEMRDMYDLFSRLPSSVEYLREALCEQIKEEGKNLIADFDRGISDASSFVRGVLAMRERYTNIWEKAFRSEKKTAKRIKESFEHFLNSDGQRSASCLATYVDELLRSGLKGASVADTNKEINKVILFFRYLSDKDIFECYYKQYLAKRLLAGRSVSDEAERTMVSQLKAECGYQYTSKFEGMFIDLKVSKEIREAFKRSQQSRETKTVDLEVDVLTTGYWPSQNVPCCVLPEKVKDATDQFAEFYLQKYTGRKLSWHTSTGTAEMRATFGKDSNKLRRHDLCVSTYQMCILMLFNQKLTWTLAEINTATEIPDMKELRRHLISLCTPKHRILRKGSKGKGISGDDDTFTFNHDYTSKMKRVKVPLVSMKEEANIKPGGGGSKSTIPVAVEEDRRHQVEAAVVRVMKSRKTLHHNNLIAEVSKQLSVRFMPTPQFIKKRIESLIEREYLERADNDHRLYNYVA